MVRAPGGWGRALGLGSLVRTGTGPGLSVIVGVIELGAEEGGRALGQPRQVQGAGHQQHQEQDRRHQRPHRGQDVVALGFGAETPGCLQISSHLLVSGLRTSSRARSLQHIDLPTQDMLKEENEMAVLGAPQSQAPVTTTVINIPRENSVPDHIVWSLFNTVFLNWCCLGFVAFAYSVKPHQGRRSLHTQLQNTSLVRKRGRCCKDPDPCLGTGRWSATSLGPRATPLPPSA
ncbi:uncharacterized protein [Bos indicus]|uniref:Uncharacterized protein isoform X4 n=1 Tax=Bos indicus TaxID=9915 RepID=A0ABM4RTB9_BOSIN